MSLIRENWRITLLIFFVIGSAVVLFVPGAPPGTSADQAGATNLQYGIQLDGGTRLQAPPVGVMADGVDVANDQESSLATDLSREFGLDSIDVRVSAGSGTVEVFSKNVSTSELRTALEEQGYNPDSVDRGVTQSTIDDVVDVIQNRITESALGSGTVSTIQTAGGDTTYVSISAPDRDADELRSIIADRGVVRILAGYPAENGTYVTTEVLSRDDIADVGNARESGPNNQPGVDVTVADSAATRFQEDMVEYGFDQQTFCNYNNEDPQNSSGRCMMTELNGEVVFSASVEQGLAELFATGEFDENPVYTSSTGSMDEARELELSLKTGSLATTLNFDEQRTQTLDPALAERFRLNSLITGIMAVLAVSGMVYLRYRDPRVALPMIVTAMSEVLILLGFVALVQYPLNLSHIAGFIAVIGTGVDDLIIIADEILQQGKVATGRVFQNRFRKAFWVIGAAAATTIIAMSPLTFLGLGDLTGFAIVTIVGVLVGVLITRPAYGDILRHLVLSEDKD